MCVYVVIAYVTLLVVVGNFVPSGPAEIQYGNCPGRGNLVIQRQCK